MKDERLTDVGKAFDGFYNLSPETREGFLYSLLGIVKGSWGIFPAYTRTLIIKFLDECFDEEVKKIIDQLKTEEPKA